MVKKDKLNINHLWASLRIGLGLILLWAFLDKLFGLGFSTCFNKKSGLIENYCSSAALNGGSATDGFLNFGIPTNGVFYDFFHSLVGNPVANFLFLAGLGLIGLALTFGIAMRIAVVSGVVLFLSMWASLLDFHGGSTNPLIDDHIIYSLVLVGLLLSNKSQVWGYGKAWQNISLVKKNKWLE
jgi:thiosulfate dehydrogenase [quinone] large subunit